MVEDVQEWATKGLLWRIRSKIYAIWMILFSKQFVAIRVSFPGSHGEYKLTIKYVGLFSKAVPKVVGEWVDVAKGGNRMLDEAQRLTEN